MGDRIFELRQRVMIIQFGIVGTVDGIYEGLLGRSYNVCYVDSHKAIHTAYFSAEQLEAMPQ